MKLLHYIKEYKYYLTGLGLKDKTIVRKLRILSMFIELSFSGTNMDVRDVKEGEFISFICSLKDKNLSTGTINQNLSILRQFFNWLYKNDLLLSPIADSIPSVKVLSKEKAIFTINEINLFLDSIVKSIRDRLFFELLYSSGLRCAEALNLKWNDISVGERKLRVDQGKGNRDRFIPYSLTVVYFLKKWKKRSYVSADNYLFPGETKGHISYKIMRRSFNKYLEKSGIDRKGLSIHSIRHSCATHLLESGADVRYVSELLGHNSIETTVKYTHPSYESQLKAYRMYHPRENGYFKEIDTCYRKGLQELRRRLQRREDVLDRIRT